jgi:signal transduction histidine kinase
MLIIYFLYGLAFFSLGIVIWAEKRHASDLPLAHQLHWLAAFAFTHSLVEWLDLFIMIQPENSSHAVLEISRSILLPLSCLLLVRFGIGLIEEAGRLPDWMTLAPIVLIVPLGLVLGYAVILIVTAQPVSVMADVWSRYLLYFPGNLLAGIGFMRQSKRLTGTYPHQARRYLNLIAMAFFVNAITAGLIVPAAPGRLSALLNYESVQSLTGVPVQVWRMLVAVAITVFSIGVLRVFETERDRKLVELEQQQQQAQETALQAKAEALHTAENWTEALVATSRRIADMDNVDQVLQTIMETARRLLNADLAALALWNEGQTSLEMRCAALPQGTMLERAQTIHEPIFLEAAQKQHPSLYPETNASHSDRLACPALGRDISAAAIIPLRLEGQVLGIFWVGREASHPFSPADLSGLERLAAQAVIALEHALMAARLQSLAVMEERGRIAREMHDGLAQVLGYVSVELQTIELFTKDGKQESALAELEQARRNVQLAQADVRENILSLRTTLSDNAGLLPALREYIEEYGVQTGIEARFACSLSNDPPLSPVVEAQIVRIVQEALTNVRKHSQAKKAQVRLAQRSDCLSITISDDGTGFEFTNKRGHYGLLTMRERAESAGGGLTVNSQLGQGTQVELWVPLLK